MDLFNNYSTVLAQAAASSYFAKCGFVACNNDDSMNGKILVMGINPSTPANGQYIPTPSYANPFLSGHPYFDKLGAILPNHFKQQTGYLDLLPFFEKEQSTLLSNIRGNESLIANVLRVTQIEMERITPSLLIVASKAVQPYLGAVDDCIWMGYDFVPVAKQDLPESVAAKDIDIRIIKGYRQGEFAERDRIYRPADGICRLRGTVAVMYKHSRGLAEEEKLTPELVDALSVFANQVKAISKYL